MGLTGGRGGGHKRRGWAFDWMHFVVTCWTVWARTSEFPFFPMIRVGN